MSSPCGGGQLMRMAACDRALVNLTWAEPRPEEMDQIRQVIANGPDWAAFWATVQLNDVAPLVYRNLRRFGLLEQVPAEWRTRFMARAEEIRGKNLGRREVAGRLFQRCREVGVQVIVLKGMLFAETIYGDPGYKKMNDLDILVRFADLTKLRAVYRELDLVPLALLEGGHEEPEEHKNYHLPAFISRDLRFVVGTHWALCSPKSGYRLDHAGIWERAKPARVADQDVLGLSPEDGLHHLCTHFHYYKNGLKELGDFANLLRSTPDFDWGRFAKLVQEAGTATPTFRALRLVEAVYGCGIPVEAMTSFREKAERFTVRDTLRLANRADLLVRSRSTWSSEIEKSYLAFSFESAFSRKWPWFLMFWRRLLLPPREILDRTNGTRPGEEWLFWLLTMNVYRTAREVGKQFGLLIFVLLMGKMTWELVSSIVAGATGGGTDKMAELRRELGQDEARIRSLLESME